MASRTWPRLTPNYSASTRSGGSLSPGCNCPDVIKPLNCRIILSVGFSILIAPMFSKTESVYIKGKMYLLSHQANMQKIELSYFISVLN